LASYVHLYEMQAKAYTKVLHQIPTYFASLVRVRILLIPASLTSFILILSPFITRTQGLIDNLKFTYFYKL